MANNYSTKQPRCSFCGKLQNQVERLIAGPNVYICNECIDLCNDIITEEDAFAGKAGEKTAGKKDRSRSDGGAIQPPLPAEMKRVLDRKSVV